MIIVDTRSAIPLDISRLDWTHAKTEDTPVGSATVLPLYSEDILKQAQSFAFDIAYSYPWTWPDCETISTALACDVTRSHPRFSLRIGVRPAKDTDDEIPEEWAEFEARRRAAIRQYEQSGGGEVYDFYPVMLTESEEYQVRSLLFNKLDIY